jgi:sarcosine oxidase subunit gamma
MTAEHPASIDLAQIDVRAGSDLVPFAAPPENAVGAWIDRDVLWLGPDEWLVVDGTGTSSAIEQELEVALAGKHHSMIDVSANRSVLDLTDGLDLLSSGCGLDLDPSHWRPGMCAQTLFGGTQVILHQLDERTTRVFVRPSFADHFIDRLTGARQVS